MSPERLEEIRSHLLYSVSRSTEWWKEACRDLLAHLNSQAEPQSLKSDPEEYRRLAVIDYRREQLTQRGWYAQDTGYLLDLLDQRDRILHDQSLDAQWAADAERGRIVVWLREQATRKCVCCAGRGRVRDPVPYVDTSPCPECNGSRKPSLEAVADDLEAQGIPEPLPTDHLRARVAELERALREILALRTQHERPSFPLAPIPIAEVARKALEGDGNGG